MEIPGSLHRDEILNFIHEPDSGRLYKKGKLLGKGAFGRCYKFTDVSTRQVFAVKMIAHTRKIYMLHRGGVEKEIELHSQLKHKNIVRFYHHFQDQKHMYMVLEYCRHKSLAHILRVRKLMTEPEVRYYMKQILHGVHFLHQQGIIHRDLKLSNFFISKNMVVKIGDFGLATTVDQCEKIPGVICGTPNYLSPEVLAKDGHSFKSDIWALGCIMYTLLTGYSPFRARSQKEMYYFIREGFFPVPNYISPNAKQLIMSLLSNHPDDRPRLEDVLAHDFFTQGFTPEKLSSTTCHTVPSFLLSSHLNKFFQKAAKVLFRGVFQKPMCTECSINEGHDNDKLDPAQSQMFVHTDKIYEREEELNDYVRPHQESLNILMKGRMSHRIRSASKKLKTQRSKRPLASLLNSHSLVFQMAQCVIKALRHFLCNCYQRGTLEEDESPKFTMICNNHLPRNLKETTEDIVMEDLTFVLQRCLYNITPGVLDPNEEVMCPILWVTKWVDYSNKYGFGFHLSDGCTGVLLSDGSHITLYPHLEIVCYSTTSREHITFPEWSPPCRLDEKMKILQFFSEYMQEKILEGGNLRAAPSLSVRTLCLLHFLKTDQALLMLFSNGTLQVNFYHDRTKIILSRTQYDYLFTYVDQDRHSCTVPLASLQQACPPLIILRVEYALKMLLNLQKS